MYLSKVLSVIRQVFNYYSSTTLSSFPNSSGFTHQYVGILKSYLVLKSDWRIPLKHDFKVFHG